MRLFLDTSVLLAAAGSPQGGSRAIFDRAQNQQWQLVTSRYCVAEVLHNLWKLSGQGRHTWHAQLSQQLEVAPDVITLDKPLAFPRAKDKPVLITALAESCHTLLTLDKKDFGQFLNHTIYGLWVRTPAGFLQTQEIS